MKRKLILSAAIVTAAALVVSMGLTVFAAGSTDSSADTNTVTATAAPQSTDGSKGGKGAQLTDEQKAERKAKMDAHMKATLAQLVSEGKITQADADAAYKLISESTGRIDFSTLPQTVQDALKANHPMQNAAGLTDEQHTALQTAMEANLKTALQALVTDKTITQVQADAITAHTKGALKDSDLTTAQKDAVKKAMSSARTAAIDQLTKAGTITTAQAEILKTRSEKGQGHKGQGGCKGGQCPAQEDFATQE